MEKEHQTFFITGATGYLGSNLVRALILKGHNVFCLRRKISNTVRLIDLEAKIAWVDLETLDPVYFFQRNTVDCVIHCATDYGRKIIDPIQTIEANLILPLKLLHGATVGGVPVFINTDTILDKGVNNYSLSKAQFSEWLNSYASKIVAINLALQHFYGPGDDPTKFVTYVIQCLLQKQERLKLTAGQQRRDFIYIGDVLDAIFRIVEAAPEMKRAYYRFEVGSGISIKIRDFVELVKELSDARGTALDFGALPYRKGELMETSTDLKGIVALGWSVTTSLKDGLRQTITIEREKLGL